MRFICPSLQKALETWATTSAQASTETRNSHTLRGKQIEHFSRRSQEVEAQLQSEGLSRETSTPAAKRTGHFVDA